MSQFINLFIKLKLFFVIDFYAIITKITLIKGWKLKLIKITRKVNSIELIIPP